MKIFYIFAKLTFRIGQLIRLNVANLEATEILSRDQLKSIFGGNGSGSSGSGAGCVVHCYDFDDDPNATKTDYTSCPTTANYGCTTKYNCCTCAG